MIIELIEEKDDNFHPGLEFISSEYITVEKL
jgi:hypothetical protein